MVVIEQNRLYSGESGIVLGQGGCIREKLLYSNKSGITPESSCIWAKWLYSGKLVVFGQKWLYSGKTGFIQAK